MTSQRPALAAATSASGKPGRGRRLEVVAAAARTAAASLECAGEGDRSEGGSRLKLKLTPEICEEVLTGTLTKFGTSESKKTSVTAPRHQGLASLSCLGALG